MVATADEVAQLRAELQRVVAELQNVRARADGAAVAAPAAVAAEGQTSGRGKEMRNLLDSKIITKVETFKGGDAEWVDWKFTMLIASGLVALDVPMLKAETSTETDCLISAGKMTTENEVKSRALYYFLCSVVRGKALA